MELLDLNWIHSYSEALMAKLFEVSMSANYQEKTVVNKVLKKVHGNIMKTHGENIPNTSIKFAKVVKNIAEGEVKSLSMKGVVNPEKITILAIRKLFDMAYIKNDFILFAIKQGYITSL